MEKVKNVVKNNKILSLVLLLVVAYAGYVTFNAGVLDAARGGTIGQLRVYLEPAHTSLSTEILKISYDEGGTLDLTNWWFSDADGNVHIFMPEAIAQGEVLTICSDKSKDASCDLEWSMGDIWDDSGDTVTIHNDLGAKVLEFTYGVVTAGTPVEHSVEYVDDTRGNGSRISLCHTKNNGSVSQTFVSANNLGKSLGGNNTHDTHTSDIIPSFYYESGGGFTLYPGLNWPDLSGIHENGCQ